MQAQPGRIYVLIQDGRVHDVFMLERLSHWNDALHVIDVTDLAPRPKIGDYWRDGVFYPDPGPAPDPYHVFDQTTYTWKPLDAITVDQLKMQRAVQTLDGDRLARTLFEVIYQLVNDVQAIKGQSAITRAQLRDQLISVYKAL